MICVTIKFSSNMLTFMLPSAEAETYNFPSADHCTPVIMSWCWLMKLCPTKHWPVCTSYILTMGCSQPTNK